MVNNIYNLFQLDFFEYLLDDSLLDLHLHSMNYLFFVGWLFGFYGISTFFGYLTPNHFLYK